jgi:hypothetical protein
MPAERSMGPAVLYYIGLGIVVAGIALFWRMVLPGPVVDEAGVPSAFEVLQNISPLIGFLLSPVFQLIALFIGAAVTQVMLLLLSPDRGSYSRTVRMYCFASSPGLFAVIPYAGAFIGMVWSVVIAVIGVREVHRISTGRAAAAVLLPVVLLLLAAFLLAVLAVAFAVVLAK